MESKLIVIRFQSEQAEENVLLEFAKHFNIVLTDKVDSGENEQTAKNGAQLANLNSMTIVKNHGKEKDIDQINWYFVLRPTVSKNLT